MLYQISHAYKSYGAFDIFEDIQFEIKSKEKIALVGRNGCGKTTLLRCMVGMEQFDRGNVAMQNGTVIGYLSQKVLENDEITVHEELEKIYTHVFELQERMHQLEEQMKHDSSQTILDQYANLIEKFEAYNGYHYQEEMQTVFTKFGFQLSELDKKIGEFSGGQKTRIGFVKLLLEKPDILLLDEPTNHLDLPTIEWLEGYIKNYPRAVVIVSHDRMFLDRTSEFVYELEYGKMTKYAGNYSSFVEQKKNSIEKQMSAYQRQQKDIARLKELIEKFRYKKNKAAFAQSKIKYLERMDVIEEVKGSDAKTFHANFTPRVKGGEKVLDVDHLQIGYDQILAEVTFSMRRGDRIAIIGENGTGKSTLVKTLMNLVEKKGGNFLFGHQIEIGYFDQQLAQFNSNKTVLEELWDENPDLDRTAIRSVLGQFLFEADDVFKTVDVLSGGEKVRLSFAKLLLQHSNLLILDEPTNHLDIPGKEALEDALKGFSGTILFVSHDRYFIRQISNKLLVLEDQSCHFIEMDYQAYEESHEKDVIETVQPKQVSTREVVLSKPIIEKQIKKVEEEITRKEQELEEKRALRFEPEYYQDYQNMAKLDELIDDIHNELAHLYQKWEDLSEVLQSE